MANSKKETRIMKVTMDKAEFEKYDKGITHSDNGLRNDRGRLSALPDIEPISESDLPERKIIRQETVYVEKKPEKESVGTVIGHAVVDIVIDVLSDPEIQEGLAKLGKAFWYHKVKPQLESVIQWAKSDKKFKSKASHLIESNTSKTDVVYELEVVERDQEKITVSEAEADKLMEMMREEARRLSAMIYLLSNITVKNKKTQDEYVLEQAYIKQLLSEESKNTMEMLLANKKLLDEDTAACFSDFLNGYIRRADRLIAIPINESESNE